MGVCPQTDIIFELLTAVEHVELFAGLKGNPVTREEAIELLQEVSLDLKHADEMATGATQYYNRLSVFYVISLIQYFRIFGRHEAKAHNGAGVRWRLASGVS